MSWDAYAQSLEGTFRIYIGACTRERIERCHRGGFIYPKADGKLRPLGIAAMEDKVVQAALVMVLTPIYEAEFLGFSYGFRPGRSQHDALDALAFGIKGRYSGGYWTPISDASSTRSAILG